MTQRKLTNPQAKLLKRAMHETVAVASSNYRTAKNLAAKGYGELVGDLFTVSREGLEALLYDRKLEDWRRGSMATAHGVLEVVNALADLPVGPVPVTAALEAKMRRLTGVQGVGA